MAGNIIEAITNGRIDSYTQATGGPFGIGYALPATGFNIVEDDSFIKYGFKQILESDESGARWLKMHQKKLNHIQPKSDEHAHSLSILKLLGMECQLRVHSNSSQQKEYEGLRNVIIKGALKDSPRTLFSCYNAAVILALKLSEKPNEPPRNDVLKLLRKAFCWQSTVALMRYDATQDVLKQSGLTYRDLFLYAPEITVSWFEKTVKTGSISYENMYQIICCVLQHLRKIAVPRQTRLALETMIGWLHEDLALTGNEPEASIRERYKTTIDDASKLRCNTCSNEIATHGQMFGCGHMSCFECFLTKKSRPCDCDAYLGNRSWCPYHRYHPADLAVPCPVCGPCHYKLGMKNRTPGYITCYSLESQERMLLNALTFLDTLERHFIEGQNEFIECANEIRTLVCIDSVIKEANEHLCDGKRSFNTLRSIVLHGLSCVVRLKTVSDFFYEHRETHIVPIKNFALEISAALLKEKNEGKLTPHDKKLLTNRVHTLFDCEQ